MNWQHCGHHTFFPSHSYEKYYQGIRRSWRFGRVGNVYSDIIGTAGGMSILKNIRRKDEEAKNMFKNMILHMKNELSIDRNSHIERKITLPNWI